MKVKIAVLLILTMLVSSSYAQEDKKIQIKKKHQYEEMDFEDMMRRYFAKETGHDLEGIYSVSCVITRKRKVFLSQREKTKVMERKDNYARIAILKDHPGSKRDFIEVSLSFHDAKKFPIVGHINSLSQGQGYIYHHVEPDGTTIPFSMISESAELLEGEFSKMKGRKTITYRLSYIKTYPKTNTSLVADN